MSTEQYNVDFHIESLSKEVILNFLRKNAQDHYTDLNQLIDLDKYSRKLSEKALHFTAYNHETLIALCSCYFNDYNSKIGYISGISISKNYRRMDIGSQLIKKVSTYGKSINFKQLQVKPDCNNTVLLNFFMKNGFSIYSKIENRYLLNKNLSV